ncbi:MAG: glycosyltransferase, partial [Acidobacteriota bacterium]
AVGSLFVQAGRDIAVAADAETFASRILDLLSHPERARRLGNAGRSYVEARHDWNQIGGQLEQIYQRVIAGRSGPLDSLPVDPVLREVVHG